MNEDVIDALLRVIDVLERLQVPYAVGGSIAGMFYGEIRTTLDADLVAELQVAQAGEFVSALRSEFYLDETAVRRAIQHRSSFNVIHLRTLSKVDVFVPLDRPFDSRQMRRRRLESIAPPSQRQVWITSPEDILLHKLEGYRKGGEVSDRQWRDILGILKSVGSQLDAEYLRQAAAELDLVALLTRARIEAGTGSD